MNRGSVPQYLPEAAVAFEKALERNPDQPNANFYLATVYYELGQFNKAIDHYRKELLLNPDHVAAMSDFGHLSLYAEGSLQSCADLGKSLKD